MASMTVKDTNRMSWAEFDELIDALIAKTSAYFSANGGKVDVVTPLLRSGGVVGGVVAIKMHVFTMLPVQFKYSYHPTVVNQIISIPDILTPMSADMNIVLCEGNTSTGSIAVRAAMAIKEKYPASKIYLATLTKVHGGPEHLEGIEEIFYGRMTDENFKASEDEIRTLDLRKGITIFPWENAEEELADINAEL
jgi:hypothetical protein